MALQQKTGPPMQKIPDFTDAELWTARSTLEERYGEAIETELADCEIRLHPSDRTLTECPALLWNQRNANFIIIKIAESEYRSQFYYRGYQQYGTGHQSYDNIGDCVVTLLQVQSDHERSQANDK